MNDAATKYYESMLEIHTNVAEKKMEVVECKKRLLIQMEENEILRGRLLVKALAEDSTKEDIIEDDEGSQAALDQDSGEEKLSDSSDERFMLFNYIKIFRHFFLAPIFKFLNFLLNNNIF